MATAGAASSILGFHVSERRTGQGIRMRHPFGIGVSPRTAASKVSSMRVRSVRVHPNKRLKLAARVGY